MDIYIAPASTATPGRIDRTSQQEIAVVPGSPLASRSADPACSQEPIHIPGSIQPHGALLVVDPLRDWTVVAASRNATTMLNASSFAGRVIGRSSGSILGLHFAGGTKTFSRQ